MRKFSFHIAVLFTVLGFLSGNISATTYFSNGTVNDINSRLYGNVEVRGVLDFWGTLELTTVNLLPGAIVGGDNQKFFAYGGSEINLLGGVLQSYVRLFENSIMNVSSGEAVSLRGYEYSHINISGGEILYNVGAGSGSVIEWSGGTIGGVIKAGYESDDHANVIIRGSDFAIDGVSVGNGIFTASVDGSARYGMLTGTLLSGEAFSNQIRIVGDSTITLIPEPATVLLLGFGGLFFRRLRR